MAKINKFLFLNQMAGPLFRELAEDLAKQMPSKCVLLTGHPDTLTLADSLQHLMIAKAPVYNRSSKLNRVLSWLHYSVIAFWYMLKADKQTCLFIVSNPPFLGFLAWFVKSVKKTPYVVLVYDIHPETLVSFGVLDEQSWLTKIWRKINKQVWSNAVAVYTIGKVMAEKLTVQFSAEKTTLGEVGVIPPWADTNNIKPLLKSKNPLAQQLNQEDKITVLYSGNMGISHDIECMLQASKSLSHRNDINFLFIGEGAKWQTAVDFVKQHSLKNVRVLPFQPEDQLPFTMTLGDISLVTLDKGAEGLMIPSKMYYYMAAGSAIIGICQGRNDLALTLQTESCGVIVDPGKPEAISKAITDLVDNKKQLNILRQNARRAAEKKYSRSICMRELLFSLNTSGIINLNNNL